jgi:hypothetical protein
MGEPGRYKTTTIARMAGLWREGKPCLPVGSGLTTVCEMIIRSGAQAAVDVIPHEDVDIQAWVKNWTQGKTTDGLAITPEIDRALRSMSGLTVRRKRGPDGKPFRGPDGKPVTEDPIEELRAKFGDPDQLSEEVMRLINLPGRRTRSLTCPDGEDGVAWLESVVANINSGRQEDISLPKSITITLPTAFGPNLPFRLTAVDTKGIDGTTQREDLMTHLEDMRRRSSAVCRPTIPTPRNSWMRSSIDSSTPSMTTCPRITSILRWRTLRSSSTTRKTSTIHCRRSLQRTRSKRAATATNSSPTSAKHP